MPLFKGNGHKSKPNRVIAYVTDKEKDVLISSQAMDNTKGYATQFRETCKMFGKGSRYDERKYYHFKLSCDLADNVSSETYHQLAQQLANELFPIHECVIATHNDTEVIHSHILVNSVSFETGKKLHLNDREYADCKDTANIFGEKNGAYCIGLAYSYQRKTSQILRKVLAIKKLSQSAMRKGKSAKGSTLKLQVGKKPYALLFMKQSPIAMTGQVLKTTPKITTV